MESIFGQHSLGVLNPKLAQKLETSKRGWNTSRQPLQRFKNLFVALGFCEAPKAVQLARHGASNPNALII